MATLTIRNLPDEVHERLKEQAKRNRRSLNQEVIAELVGGDAGQHAVKRQHLLDAVKRFRAGLKRPLSAEEIREFIDEGRP